MTNTDKNIFSTLALTRLVELRWSQVRLAKELRCSRVAVNRAIHTHKFPRVRQRIVRKLKIDLSLLAA